MAKNSDAEFLRQLVAKIRAMPNALSWLSPKKQAEIGGKYIESAILRGAFAGPEHAAFIVLVDNQKLRRPGQWDGIWTEAINVFAKDLYDRLGPGNSILAACPQIADALEGETRIIEGSLTALQVNDHDGGMDQTAIEYLMSWREILDELKQKNDEEKRNRIRRLNDTHDGPIIFSGQGAQPTVDKAKLVPWWNGLEKRLREMEQQQIDRQATVADQVSYGTAGTVVPGISGEVKKRRKDRKS